MLKLSGVIFIFMIFSMLLWGTTEFEEHYIGNEVAGPSGIFTGDIDNDGDLDFAVAASDLGEVSWWSNEGGDPLTFEKKLVDQNIPGAIYVFVEDVNGDGFNDLLGAAWNAGEIVWWENDCDNQEVWLRHSVDEEFPLAHEVYACDLDLDNDIDIIGASADNGEIAWWENIGENTLDWAKHSVDTDFAGARSIAVGDFDGDGDRDLVGAALLSNEISCWINEGFNLLNWIRYDLSQDFMSSHKVDIADMDGDDDPDVLGTGYTSDEISWWCNNGGNPNTWEKHVVDQTFNGAVIGYAADFDLDGDIDVAGSAQLSSQIAWWENSEGNSLVWEKHQLNQSFLGAWPLHYGDLDGDGDTDIVAGAYDTNELRWYENKFYGIDFKAEPLTGNCPLEVSFTDLSNFEETITNREWDFDNDGVIDSYETDPVWTYQEQGNYSPTLTVQTTSFSKTLVKQEYIHVFDGDSGLDYDADPAYSYCSVLNLNIIDDFAFEAWLTARQTGEHYHTIIDKDKILVFINEDFPIYNTNSYVIQITHADENVSRAMTPENSVIYGNWQHLAITYDGYGDVSFYLNGVEQVVEYVGTCSGNISDNQSGGIFIGNSMELNQNFEGIIDEIRIWDYERTGNDIMMNMLTYLSGSENGLEVNWRFNEGYGEIFTDNTGQQDDGIINGAVWVQGLLLTPVETDQDLLPEPIIDLENYPNPFSPAASRSGCSLGTIISYHLTETSNVDLSIYNIKGQLVKTLIKNIQPAGKYHIGWNGRTDEKRELPQGLYLYKLCVDGISTTRKMMMLK